MKRKRVDSARVNDFLERSMIICLALIAIVALNFLYSRKAFAAAPMAVAQVQPAPNPELEQPTEPVETETGGIDDTIIPPSDTVTETLQKTGPVTDASLLAQIHEINQMEMQMGELARNSGEADIVKRYGHRIAADHRYVDQRLLSLAEGMSMDISASPLQNHDQSHSRQVATLSSLTGATFDGTFLEMMEQGHREAIDLLMNARNQLPVDSKVRLFAGQILPILQQHLDVVGNLQGRKY